LTPRKPTSDEEMDAILKENQRRYILSELRVPLRCELALQDTDMSLSTLRMQGRDDVRTRPEGHPCDLIVLGRNLVNPESSRDSDELVYKTPRKERLTKVLSSILNRKKTLSALATSGTHRLVNYETIAQKSLPNINVIDGQFTQITSSPGLISRINTNTRSSRGQLTVAVTSAKDVQTRVNSGQQSACSRPISRQSRPSSQQSARNDMHKHNNGQYDIRPNDK
jgi:hypothetical protein